jgi:hypothetical protein
VGVGQVLHELLLHVTGHGVSLVAGRTTSTPHAPP